VEPVRFIAASGGLGGGKVDADALADAMKLSPHFIASDAGTTDAGPHALGSGIPAYPRESVIRDLALFLPLAHRAGIPVLIGSAGTAGIDSQVDWLLDIARDIAKDSRIKVRTAAIYSEQNKDYLKGLYRHDKIRALDPAPHVDEDVIDRSSHIVGMMGVEPLQRALAEGAQLIVAGRCSDAALYAALPIMKGLPPGLSWHAGKVVECGTLVCEVASKGAVFGTISEKDVVIRPFGKNLRCTPQSVAAHTFYESSDPHFHVEASGTMDLSRSTYRQADGVSVAITGSEFIPADPYTIKLEGAERVGFQSLIIGGVRDPLIIRQLDSWLAGIKAKIVASVADIFRGTVSAEVYRLDFHVYGRNAVMGALEPMRNALPHEVGIVLEVTAPAQDIASKIAALCRQPLLHHPIPEWKGAITGFACLHNPAVIERGAVYRFSLNHVAVPRTPHEMFRTSMMDIG
jgi:hypothetical protein